MPRGNFSAHRRGTTSQSRPLSERALLSQSPEKAIQEMMETIDALRGVYIEETTALEAADTPAFLSVQDKKLNTAMRYERGIQEIIARKEEMRKIDPALKRRLETMQNDFSNIAKENMEALTRMQRTMERLGNTIRDAAKEAVNQQRAYSYGESGALQSNEKRVVSTGISETA